MCTRINSRFIGIIRYVKHPVGHIFWNCFVSIKTTITTKLFLQNLKCDLFYCVAGKLIYPCCMSTYDSKSVLCVSFSHYSHYNLGSLGTRYENY